MNIKLPGKFETKKRILIILVMISIVIIGYEGIINHKHNKSEIKEYNNEEIIENAADTSIEKSDNESKEIDTISQDSNGESYSEEENSLYNEAYTLFFSHEYNKSISKSNELVSKYPENPLGYNIRGIAKSYSGDYESGMSDIDKSLKLKPDYGYARFNKALTYELFGHYDEALQWYDEALEVEDYVWSYYGIASIYGRKGDIDNTVKYLKKAIELDSNVKKEAQTEEDFAPVRDYKEFKELVEE